MTMNREYSHGVDKNDKHGENNKAKSMGFSQFLKREDI
jgi:hypothetical protein